MFSQPSGSGGANSPPRALNIVLAFHCDAITTTLGQLPGSSPLAQAMSQLLQSLQQQVGKSVCP